MKTSHHRGHPIWLDESWCPLDRVDEHGQSWYFTGTWRYADTGDAVFMRFVSVPGAIDRPCAKCGEWPTPEGYDSCIGYVDGARSVCCGHGAEEGYVIYKDDPPGTRGKGRLAKLLEGKS